MIVQISNYNLSISTEEGICDLYSDPDRVCTDYNFSLS